MKKSAILWWSSLGKVERLAVVLLALYAALQLLAPLYIPIDGHDSPEHLYWMDAFHALQRQGIVYPRWLNDSFDGLGAPTFYFYPPITALSSSLLRFAIPFVSTVTIFQLLGSLSTIISFFGCKQFLKRLHVSVESSIVGGLLYAFAPYRFFDLYIRASIGEHLAFAILPWMFLALEAMLEKEEKQKPLMFAWLSLTWALLVMTNLPTGALAGLCIPVYLLVRRSVANRNQVLQAIGALLLGTLCAAIYLFPILQFYSKLNYGGLDGQLPGFSTGNAWLDLILGKNLMSNRLYCSLMLLSGILLLARYKKIVSPNSGNPDGQRVIRGFQALLWVALAFQLPYITLPLFAKVPPFSMIQFPWRWDVIVLLSSAVLAGFLWDSGQRRYVLPLIFAWALGGVILLPFKAAGIHTRYLPAREIVEPGEYLPAMAASHLSTEIMRAHAKDAFLLTDDSSIRIRKYEANATSRRLTLTAPHLAKATFHIFVWPEWRLTIADKSADSYLPISSDSIGRMTAQVPAGTYTLSLDLIESTSEKYGKLVSILALCCVIGVTAYWYSRNSRKSRLKGITKS